MKNKTNSIIRSFIIVPMLASGISMNVFTASIQNAVLSQGQSATSVTPSPEQVALQKEREETAAKIDAYFGKHNLPLTGYGMTFVLAGEKYSVDPMLVAAIAMRESTGCKFIPKGTFNCFGWGNTKFDSYEHAIDMVTKNLGGHNERTARYYKGKSTRAILETYNPPSVVPTYAGEVMGIMKKIDAIIPA